MLPEYASTSMLDFSRPENDTGMKSALESVRSRFGTTYPLVIGGERIKTSDTFQCANPANPSECVGNFSKAITNLPPILAGGRRGRRAWRHSGAADVSQRAN